MSQYLLFGKLNNNVSICTDFVWRKSKESYMLAWTSYLIVKALPQLFSLHGDNHTDASPNKKGQLEMVASQIWFAINLCEMVKKLSPQATNSPFV